MPAGKEPAKRWFENLERIRKRMEDLNNLTEPKLKPFSKQKPSDLLTSDLLKGNLSQFCQEKLSLNVPNAAYNEKTFREFLNFISFSIEEAIFLLFYRVAVKFSPTLLDLTRKEVSNMTVEKVYGQDPLSSNTAKKELHKLLLQNIQEEFYVDSNVILDSSTQKLKDLINKILDK